MSSTSNAEYFRRWRSRRDATAILKDQARARARTAKRRGILVPKPCHCGSTDVEMHHADYSRPLAVSWVCKACHVAIHYRNPNSRAERLRARYLAKYGVVA